MMTWEERHPTTLEGWENLVRKIVAEYERKKREAAEEISRKEVSEKKIEEENIPVPADNNNEERTVMQEKVPVPAENNIVVENTVAPRKKRKYTRRVKEVISEQALEAQFQQAMERSPVKCGTEKLPVPTEDEIVADNPFDTRTKRKYTKRVEEVAPGQVVEMHMQQAIKARMEYGTMQLKMQNQCQQKFINYPGQFDGSASSMNRQQEPTSQYNYSAPSSQYYPVQQTPVQQIILRERIQQQQQLQQHNRQVQVKQLKQEARLEQGRPAQMGQQQVLMQSQPQLQSQRFGYQVEPPANYLARFSTLPQGNLSNLYSKQQLNFPPASPDCQMLSSPMDQYYCTLEQPNTSPYYQQNGQY